jgi:hypothetical protein
LRFTACLTCGKTRYFCENNRAIAKKNPYYDSRKLYAYSKDYRQTGPHVSTSTCPRVFQIKWNLPQ